MSDCPNCCPPRPEVGEGFRHPLDVVNRRPELADMAAVGIVIAEGRAWGA